MGRETGPFSLRKPRHQAGERVRRDGSPGAQRRTTAAKVRSPTAENWGSMIPTFPVRSLPAIPRLSVTGLLRVRLAGKPDAVLPGHRRRAAAVRLMVNVAAAVADHLRRPRHPLAPPPFPGRHRVRLAP